MRVRVRVCVRAFTFACAFVCARVRACVHACMRACVRPSLSHCRSLSPCVFVFVSVCLCTVCFYLYARLHVNTQVQTEPKQVADAMTREQLLDMCTVNLVLSKRHLEAIPVAHACARVTERIQALHVSNFGAALNPYILTVTS